MRRVGGLVPQQIAVGARFEVSLITFARFFADRQRHGAVGITLFDRSDDITDQIIGIIRILAALQHEGAVPQRVALFTAGQDLVLAQAVTLGVGVPSAQSAVQTVIFAVRGELDQPAQIDRVAVVLAAHGVRRRRQRGVMRRIFDQRTQLSVGEVTIYS